MNNLSNLILEKNDNNHHFTEYTIVSKEKYFILKGEKHYFSALNRIFIFTDFSRPKFIFYKENKEKNIPEIVNIPPALAQDLINMFHVQAYFDSYKNVVREIK